MALAVATSLMLSDQSGIDLSGADAAAPAVPTSPISAPWKMREEIDALRTMGCDPVEALGERTALWRQWISLPVMDVDLDQPRL
jgi:ABC-type transporter Mla maintaining outer membrane lipid asymmetry permease subunit MlaE